MSVKKNIDISSSNNILGQDEILKGIITFDETNEQALYTIVRDAAPTIVRRAEGITLYDDFTGKINLYNYIDTTGVETSVTFTCSDTFYGNIDCRGIFTLEDNILTYETGVTITANLYDYNDSFVGSTKLKVSILPTGEEELTAPEVYQYSKWYFEPEYYIYDYKGISHTVTYHSDYPEFDNIDFSDEKYTEQRHIDLDAYILIPSTKSSCDFTIRGTLRQEKYSNKGTLMETKVTKDFDITVSDDSYSGDVKKKNYRKYGTFDTVTVDGDTKTLENEVEWCVLLSRVYQYIYTNGQWIGIKYNEIQYQIIDNELHLPGTLDWDTTSIKLTPVLKYQKITEYSYVPKDEVLTVIDDRNLNTTYTKEVGFIKNEGQKERYAIVNESDGTSYPVVTLKATEISVDSAQSYEWTQAKGSLENIVFTVYIMQGFLPETHYIHFDMDSIYVPEYHDLQGVGDDYFSVPIKFVSNFNYEYSKLQVVVDAVSSYENGQPEWDGLKISVVKGETSMYVKIQREYLPWDYKDVALSLYYVDDDGTTLTDTTKTSIEKHAIKDHYEYSLYAEDMTTEAYAEANKLKWNETSFKIPYTGTTVTYWKDDVSKYVYPGTDESDTTYEHGIYEVVLEPNYTDSENETVKEMKWVPKLYMGDTPTTISMDVYIIQEACDYYVKITNEDTYTGNIVSVAYSTNVPNGSVEISADLKNIYDASTEKDSYDKYNKLITLTPDSSNGIVSITYNDVGMNGCTITVTVAVTTSNGAKTVSDTKTITVVRSDLSYSIDNIHMWIIDNSNNETEIAATGPAQYEIPFNTLEYYAKFDVTIVDDSGDDKVSTTTTYESTHQVYTFINDKITDENPVEITLSDEGKNVIQTITVNRKGVSSDTPYLIMTNPSKDNVTIDFTTDSAQTLTFKTNIDLVTSDYAYSNNGYVLYYEILDGEGDVLDDGSEESFVKISPENGHYDKSYGGICLTLNKNDESWEKENCSIVIYIQHIVNREIQEGKYVVYGDEQIMCDAYVYYTNITFKYDKSE